MILIDGSHGEGGGQILRTAVGLAALTQQPCKITSIRKGRCDSGMKEQHLQAVNAVAKLCDANMVGAVKNSEELEFYPLKLRSGSLPVNISTAGSVGLVLQALLIPSSKTDVNIRVTGGATYGKWAAPFDHMSQVLFPLLNKMGYKLKYNLIKDGFFPKGGADVQVHAYESKLKPLDITEKGKVLAIKGRSVASLSLKTAQVAERQAKAARKGLFKYFGVDAKISSEYQDTLCPGSGIQLWAETENTVIGANALGEVSKRSETVGGEVVNSLIAEYENGCVDKHTADQLIPYMALAGGGKILTSEVTGHILTNAHITEQFLPVKFKIDGRLIECVRA
ncbi:RNA 3'-terminal phosphate cyclase [Candidatus Woesearchaeota archaeon]|nr:RNA 3'-terminal phosphate cyclase [Candidatus Woesearchaeota archaeon]